MLQRTELSQTPAAKAYLAAIVESSDDAIVSKDLNGVITSWNQGAERIFGYTAAEVVGKPITILLPPERQGEEPVILGRIRRGERIEHFETVRVTKDGRRLDVSLTISPVKDEQGKVIGASKIARDITAVKQTQRALEDAQRQLRMHADELEIKVRERTEKLATALTELEVFSYSVAHDLRAPLRAIQQYAQALLEDYQDKLKGEGADFLHHIIDSSDRLDTLIRDVLSYSRIVRSDVTPQAVELASLVPEVVRHYPLLQPPRAELEIVQPLLPVSGNSTFVMQSISNLLVNAVKFVAPGVKPKVRVWTEPRDRRVRVWVEDNGIGIEPQYHRKIFGMFERIQTASDYEGTGIGLAIVRKAVERMKGAVGLESEPGRGSRFWFELPGVNA